MKRVRWNQEKNERLKRERNLSFERFVEAIQRGDIVADIPHPNQDRYPNQRIFMIELDSYIYMVPYVENDSEIFLKTVIPSRKATKQYLQGDQES